MPERGVTADPQAAALPAPLDAAAHNLRGHPTPHVATVASTRDP